MRRPQPWGGARARWWVPGEQDSPVGPAFQPQGRWRDPDAWAAAARTDRARCDRLGECDAREQLLGAGAAALALLVVLVVASLRRRRGGGTRRPHAYRQA